MRQITIGICDDETCFAEELYALVYTCGNEMQSDFAIETHTDVEELLMGIESGEKEYDILFFDVEMPKMSGLNAASHLREIGYGGIICFVTSHDEYALQSYRLDGLGYIIKPASYPDVKRLLQKALIQISYLVNEQEAQKKFLEIHTQKGNLMIDMEQVIYIEKRRNQCVFHLEDGEIVCYETLKNIFPRLNQSNFCFVHQGYIVNFDKVKEVLTDVINLGSGREIPVSRKYLKDLKERKKRDLYQSRMELFG